MVDRAELHPGQMEIAIEASLRNLPLERCILEKEFLTEEQGWHAPEGYAFRITGDFTVFYNSSEITHVWRPQDSKARIIASNPELYAEFLEETGEDSEEAFSLLLRDVDEGLGEAVEELTGPWLVFGKDFIKVAEDPEIEYDRDYYQHIDNITPGAEKPMPVTFMANQGVVIWIQRYAEPEIPDFQIEFVEVELPPKALYIPKPASRELEIPWELQMGWDSKTGAEILKMHYGITLTEEQRLQLMRARRQEGRPYQDDPLRNFILPRRPIPENLILPETQDEDEEF